VTPNPSQAKSIAGLIFSILAILCISSCSEKNTAAINALLDARDTAISAHDIEAYGALLLRDYLDDTGQQANDVINKMNRLFAQF